MQRRRSFSSLAQLLAVVSVLVVSTAAFASPPAPPAAAARARSGREGTIGIGALRIGTGKKIVTEVHGGTQTHSFKGFAFVPKRKAGDNRYTIKAWGKSRSQVDMTSADGTQTQMNTVSTARGSKNKYDTKSISRKDGVVVADTHTTGEMQANRDVVKTKFETTDRLTNLTTGGSTDSVLNRKTGQPLNGQTKTWERNRWAPKQAPVRETMSTDTTYHANGQVKTTVMTTPNGSTTQHYDQSGKPKAAP